MNQTDLNQKSQQILAHYSARKTKKQKDSFILFLKNSLKQDKIIIDEVGMLHSRNIIIGNLDKADIIVTAHYDTAPKKVLPIPMVCTPNRKYLTLAIQCIPIFILAMAIRYIFILLNLPSISFIAIPLIVILPLFVGPTNYHTVNDNTSGVISIIEMICYPEYDSNKICFVLFDHEEIGMVGSKQFSKKYKEVLKDKLIINLDCVSDGDTILIMKNKGILHDVELHENIKKAFMNPKQNKKIVIEDKCDYLSDQIYFPKSLAIVACRYHSFFRYYIPNMHTDKDTILDINNIFMIASAILQISKNKK